MIFPDIVLLMVLGLINLTVISLLLPIPAVMTQCVHAEVSSSAILLTLPWISVIIFDFSLLPLPLSQPLCHLHLQLRKTTFSVFCTILNKILALITQAHYKESKTIQPRLDFSHRMLLA